MLRRAPSVVPKRDRRAERRVAALSALLILAFVGLVGRLWQLQVVRHPLYREMAETRRLRAVRIAPLRGEIVDRNGVLLATNDPAYSVRIVAADVRREMIGPLAARLADLLGVDADAVAEGVTLKKDVAPYSPLTVASGLDLPAVARVEEHRAELPGARVDVTPVRVYPQGDLAAHVIGYVGEVWPDDVDRPESPYRAGDKKGRNGAEAAFEELLRGVAGGKQVTVDSIGRVRGVVAQRDPVPGATVRLTIDSEVQRAAEDALGDRCGAIVAVEVGTGELLCLASSPRYLPQQFADGLSADRWMQLSDDPRRPLFHRAIAGEYPPGSTFKPVTALAGLSRGVVSSDTVFYCSGAFHLGDWSMACWNRAGHGDIAMVEGLAHSCNVYFAEVGLRVGIDGIGRMAGALGLGVRTGLPLPGERPGLVPTRAWKRQAMGESWYPGDTAVVAVGQGALLTTPLQMAMLYATLGSGGEARAPALLKSAEGPGDEDPTPAGGAQARRVSAAADYGALIRRALSTAVRAGTARPAALPGVSAAGKTGTAENPHGDDHAWFCGWAPADEPAVAVACVIEAGGHGSETAAPAARRVLAAALGIELPPVPDEEGQQ